MNKCQNLQQHVQLSSSIKEHNENLLQTHGAIRHPHLGPVLPDLVCILSKVIIEEPSTQTKEDKNPELSLKPSQMATKLLSRLVSILS